MRAALERAALAAIDTPLAGGVLTALERRRAGRPDELRVLTYHRVDRPEAHPELYPPLRSATPEEFERQIAFVAAHYRVLRMEDLVAAARTGGRLPPKSLVVTFDDAYCDFAEHAWPVLQRYGVPATLFVPTAFPDVPDRAFWWDALYHAVSSAPAKGIEGPEGWLSLETPELRRAAAVRLNARVKLLPHREALAWVDGICRQLGAPRLGSPVLGWEELRELSRQGVTLAAHTRTHPLLERVSLEEAVAEAVGSREDLEREIGPALPVFCYPVGSFGEPLARALEAAGFVLAFTTVPGKNDWPRADRMTLKRFAVNPRVNLGVLRARLLR
jgi:peptidoglycan/xylan/chitin deacetylase (PgdA/CDA1 family)